MSTIAIQLPAEDALLIARAIMRDARDDGNVEFCIEAADQIARFGLVG